MYERGKPIFLFSFVHIGPIIRIRKTIHFTIFSQWFVTFSTFIGFDTCRNEILNPLDKCFFFTEIRSYISDYRLQGLHFNRIGYFAMPESDVNMINQ